MMGAADLTVHNYSPAPQRLREQGVLGFATVIIGGLVIVDGIAVRRGASGRLLLSFPSKGDAASRRHYVVRPTNDAARRILEKAVFAALPAEREVSHD